LPQVNEDKLGLIETDQSLEERTIIEYETVCLSDMNRESLYQIPRHADSEALQDQNTDAERDFINKVLS
jgi:hypothetical protein